VHARAKPIRMDLIRVIRRFRLADVSKDRPCRAPVQALYSA
jgi:hypothetical protein